MMVGLRLRVEITGDALKAYDPARLHHSLDRASMMVAQYVKGVWIGLAQRLDVRRTGDYIRGVQAASIERRTDAHNGTRLNFELDITNRAPHAGIVEDGHAGFHLPQRIQWYKAGGKVKHGKSGPYLIIPMRHRAHASPSDRESQGLTTGTIKQMMPEHIYQQARSLSPSSRQGGGHPAANRYHWGGRLRRGGQRGIMLGGPGHQAEGYVETRAHWATSKFEGMVRMSHGQGGGSSYLTFRVITPRSQGWYIPAMHGMGIARRTAYGVSNGNGARRVQEIVTRAIFDAMEEQHP